MHGLVFSAWLLQMLLEVLPEGYDLCLLHFGKSLELCDLQHHKFESPVEGPLCG